MCVWRLSGDRQLVPRSLTERQWRSPRTQVEDVADADGGRYVSTADTHRDRAIDSTHYQHWLSGRVMTIALLTHSTPRTTSENDRRKYVVTERLLERTSDAIEDWALSAEFRAPGQLRSAGCRGKALSTRAKSCIQSAYPHYQEKNRARFSSTAPDKRRPTTRCTPHHSHVTWPAATSRRRMQTGVGAAARCKLLHQWSLGSRHFTSSYGNLPCKSTRVPNPGFPEKTL